MEKKFLSLLISAVLTITLLPTAVFASPPDDSCVDGLVAESLDDYPEIGSPDANFAKGVRIGDTVYTITDENGNAPFEGLALSTNTQFMTQALVALETTGITYVKAYPAYYENNSYQIWSTKYMTKSWSSTQSRVDLYPTATQYSNWVSAFNSAGKTWSHFKLQVRYTLKSDAIQFLLWNNGTPDTYGIPSDYNYTVTATTYPETGQYVNGGSYQSMTYQKSDNSWANVGAAWVYNVTQ